MARASEDACVHAASTPCASRPPPPATRDPPRPVPGAGRSPRTPRTHRRWAIANNTAIIATATRLAEPCSARTRFGRGDRLRCDGDTRQQRRSRGDSGNDQLPRHAATARLLRRAQCLALHRKPNYCRHEPPGGQPHVPASTQRTCIDTAVSPDAHSTSTTARAAIANAASTVTPPASSARRWCSTLSWAFGNVDCC